MTLGMLIKEPKRTYLRTEDPATMSPLSGRPVATLIRAIAGWKQSTCYPLGSWSAMPWV